MGFNGSPATAHPKGLYSTEQEALERAQQIGCDNVHRNNGRWMPCRDERELHRQLRKN
ncbi:gibberellin regulated-like protein [Parasynechococcus sp.]|uniref:gibberellin regulated-like protein n=1 Tax=Parasynechococcus sp. TaxID=3101203 RepID=UPI003704B0EE